MPSIDFSDPATDHGPEDGSRHGQHTDQRRGSPWQVTGDNKNTAEKTTRVKTPPTNPCKIRQATSASKLLLAALTQRGQDEH